eukprot:TRINITY_DN2853_c0_g1_i1.p1 TRINITY_DN2853_c0_g1~~TRINITY_DN2853_c0_g1_i1.p1  ORF type:complete len:482 (-),score=165.09 TRINITY_DN2853_c0_g1_i1:9-1454(-)
MATKMIIAVMMMVAIVMAQDESDVLTLTEDNFQSTIDAHPIIAVEFYAPWCGHCKNLAPEWEKAATEMKGKVAIAKVDCTTEESICGNFDVKGFPTLKIFRNGEASPLEVARKSSAIVSYLQKEMEPAVAKLKESEVDEFLKTHPVALIAYLDNDHDDRFQLFSSVANQLKQTLAFVAIIGGEKNPANTLLLRRNFDEPELKYSGSELTVDSVRPWLLRHLVPLLGEIHAENFQSYMNLNMPLGYLFLNPTEDNSALLDGIKSAVSKAKDSVAITWINNAKYGKQAERLGLSGSKTPSLAIDNHISGKRYIFPETEELTVEKLEEWLGKYTAGEIANHVKSEEIPESNDGPVKVVVAKSFDDIVLDTTKDVLLEFYAPWCGHCKTLAPIYEELGQAFKDVDSVVIAKIDATANDVNPSYGVRGFPTILFFQANAKTTPLTYEGGRTLEDLTSYIRANAQIPITSLPVDEDDDDDDDQKDEL